MATDRAVLAAVRAQHWFDPCALWLADARGEMKPECRQRERGGGYEPRARTIVRRGVSGRVIHGTYSR